MNGDDKVLGVMEPSVLTGQVPVKAEHDHEDQCCKEHGTHTNPHRGCVLR